MTKKKSKSNREKTNKEEYPPPWENSRCEVWRIVSPTKTVSTSCSPIQNWNICSTFRFLWIFNCLTCFSGHYEDGYTANMLMGSSCALGRHIALQVFRVLVDTQLMSEYFSRYATNESATLINNTFCCSQLQAKNDEIDSITKYIRLSIKT